MTRKHGRTWLSAQGPEPQLVAMILVSVLVHVAAVGALFALPRDLLSSSPPPVVAYTVKIVDPSALGGRLPQGAVRPDRAPQASADAARGKPSPPEPVKKEEKPKPAKVEKKPEAEAKKVVRIPEKPAAKPAPAKKPEAAKAAAPQVTPKPKEPTAAEKARRERDERDRRIQEAVRRAGERGSAAESVGLGGTEEGKGKALGTGGDGGGGGILTGLDFIIYKNQVEGLIKRNWTWVGSNPNLTVRVGFRIQKDGGIADVRIVERSGDTGFDQSVLRAIQASSPLPPPPDKYRDVFGDYLLDFLSGDLQSG